MKNSLTKKKTITRSRVVALFVLIAVITTVGFSATSNAAFMNSPFTLTLDKVLGHKAEDAPKAAATSAALRADDDPAAERNAIVGTDKNDYAPGDNVTITGSGWNPNETISLSLKQSRNGEAVTEYTYSAVADADGSFTNNDYTPGEADRGTDYVLTATGSDSHFTAQVTFSDAFTGNTQVQATVSYGALTAPVCPGAAVKINPSLSKVSAGTYTYQWYSGAQQFTGSNIASFSTLGSPGSITLSGSGNNLGANPNTSPAFPALNVSATAGVYYVLKVTDSTNTSLFSQTGNSTPTLSVATPDAATLSPGGVVSKVVGDSVSISVATTGTAAPTFVGWEVSNNTNQWDPADAAHMPDADSIVSSSSSLSFRITRRPSNQNRYVRAHFKTGASSCFTANVDFYSNVEQVTIDKADQTITFGALANKTYGDADFNVSATSTGNGGLSSGNPITFAAVGNCTVTGSTVHITGAGSCTITASQSGNGDWNKATDVPQTFQIAKANTTTTVSCTSPVTYSGSAQTPCTASVSGPGNLSQSLTVSYSNNTNAGTATASASYAGDANYNSSTDSKTFSINKASSTTVITCTSHVTYSGSAQTPCSANVTGAGGLNQSLSVSYQNNKDAGQATASASFSGDANHDSSSDSKNFTISKADAACAVTGTTVTYDGDPHGASGSCSGVDAGGAATGGSLSLGGNFTNVPGGAATWTFTGGNNYNDQTGSVQIVINKANATINVQGYTGTYDASAHGASGTATGVKGETLSGLNLGQSFTNVPGGAATWTFTDSTGNYNNDSNSVAITINKANAVCTVTGSTSTYDAAAHGASGSCSGVDAGGAATGGSLSLGDSFTNVPGGTATWSFTGGTNYNDQTGSVQIVINKADATCAVDGYTVTYDGTAHTATGSCKGVQGETLSLLDLSGTTHTNAGTTTDNWTFTDSSGNYNNTGGSVADAINRANATVNVTPYSVTYDGNQHTATGTATGVQNEDLSSLFDLSGTTHTNAGPYNGDAWSFAGNGNYNSTSGTVDDNIDKASSTTSVGCPSSVTFDGSAQTPCTASVTGAGGLSQSLTVNYSNNVHAGTASASASYAGDSNHNNSTDSKTFTINQAGSTTTVTCPTSVTYNGTAQTPCSANTTGAGGLNAAQTVSYSNNVHVGTANASASFAGDGDHTSSSDSKTFAISQRAVSVKADNKSKYFGDADPALTYTITSGSLAGGDSFSGTLVRVNGETVGTYDINRGTLSLSSDYALSFTKGTFSILNWTVNGFFSPVVPSTTTLVWNNIKSGSTVPLKFALLAGTTPKTSTSNVNGGSLTVATVGCSDTGINVTDAVDTTFTNSGSTALRYDATAGQFIQNWQSPSNKANTCYRIMMNAADGSSATAFFKLTK